MTNALGTGVVVPVDTGLLVRSNWVASLADHLGLAPSTLGVLGAGLTRLFGVAMFFCLLHVWLVALCDLSTGSLGVDDTLERQHSALEVLVPLHSKFQGVDEGVDLGAHLFYAMDLLTGFHLEVHATVHLVLDTSLEVFTDLEFFLPPALFLPSVFAVHDLLTHQAQLVDQ